NRDADLRERKRPAHRNASHARRTGGGRRARRIAGGRGGHASVFELDRPGDFPGRALSTHRRGNGATREVAADFWHARASGYAGPANDYRPDERRALLSAAFAGAFDQLAFLDGPKHRIEIVPHDGVPPVPAHRSA